MTGFVLGLLVAVAIVMPLVWVLHPGNGAAFVFGVAIGLVCTTIGMALDA